MSASAAGSAVVTALDSPERSRLTVVPSASALRRDDDPGALPGGRSLQPRQQLLRVADGRRQPDPLERAARDARQPLQDGDQVPAPVPGAEGMRLVHDHGAHAGEQPVGGPRLR